MGMDHLFWLNPIEVVAVKSTQLRCGGCKTFGLLIRDVKKSEFPKKLSMSRLFLDSQNVLIHRLAQRSKRLNPREA